MNQATPLDLVAVLTLIAGTVFGPQLAAVIGPYSVIVLGAVLGGAWSASRRPPDARIGTAAYILLVVLLALLLTVPSAELAARHIGGEPRWMFGPVAVIIAGVGDEWPTVVRWALRLVRSAVERWASSKAPTSGDQP